MNLKLFSSSACRRLSSRLGALLVLFQRAPLIQMLFPEARILSGAGLGDIATWTIATIAGLGVYDSVAGATTIAQLQPNAGSTTIPAANGSNLTFIFQITGTESAPLSWQIVNALPAGLVHTNSTGSTIDSITGIPTQTGNFTITIKAWEGANNTGNVYSKSFTFNVGAPIIATQPASMMILSGNTATLNVGGTGSGLTYQWYRGTSPNTTNLLSGETSSSFTTPTLTANTKYWVRVTRSGIIADSDTATISIGTPPAVTTQPVSKTINSGTTTNLTVAFSGTTPTIQWYRGAAGVTNNPVAGATSTSLTTPTLTNNANFWARATNSLGSDDSNVAAITIRIAPAITVQPVPITIDSGSTATFNVTTTGTSPTFQWYAGNPGDTSAPVAGATATSFTTPPLTSTTTYWMRASNAAGNADSTAAIATISTAGTFAVWQNSRFNTADLANPLVSGPGADPDGDGIPNISEYVFGLLPLAGDPSPSPTTSLAGNNVTLSFTASAASGTGYSGLTRRYTLEAADTLDSSWASIPGYTDITGAGQTVTCTTSANGPRKFYRLIVRLMP